MVCTKCEQATTSNPALMSAAALDMGAAAEIIGVKLCQFHETTQDLYEACQRALAVEESVTMGQERELRTGYLTMLRNAIEKAEKAPQP